MVLKRILGINYFNSQWNVLSSETRYSVLKILNVITKESCKYVHHDDNMHLKPASASGQVVGIKVESRHEIDLGKMESLFLVSGFIVVDFFDTVILYLK